MTIRMQKKDMFLGLVSLFTMSASYADWVTFNVYAPPDNKKIGTVRFEDMNHGLMAHVDITLDSKYANKQHAFHIHQCAECQLNSSATSCNPATGQAMASAPSGQTMAAPPSGQTMPTTPPGQAMPTTPPGQAMTTTPATTGNYLSAGSHYTKEDWDNFRKRGYGNNTQSSQTQDMSQNHLGPYQHGHIGDMPVLNADARGRINAEAFSQNLSVEMIRNRSVIFHEMGDDYYFMPDKVGGGGARIACGMMPKSQPEQRERRSWWPWW